MINILKRHRKKTIDIYDLAYEYRMKPTLEWSPDEIADFIQQLHDLEEQSIISFKKSPKGEAKLGFIQRRITINNRWNINNNSTGINHDLFCQELGMNASYYLKNLDIYHRDSHHIERLKAFLKRNSGELTLNELSYAVFNDEKAILQPEKAAVNGRRILTNLQLETSKIPHVETISPFYFPISPDGDTVLVVENKDTCFSLLRVLNGKESNVKGIIFGEGRTVVKIFKFIRVYELEVNDRFLYYGDIDQEGFDIARSLIENFPQYNISLSKMLYHYLLQYNSRPLKSQRNIDYSKSEGIMNSLFEEDRRSILGILDSAGCIPQEALNYDALRRIMDELQYRLS